MSSPRRHDPLRALLRLLLRAPWVALPIAAFVWFRDSGAWPAFGRYYLPTLALVLSGWLGLWAAQHFVLAGRRTPPRGAAAGTRPVSLSRRIAIYAAAMTLGFVLGALLLNASLVPGLLGGSRQVAIVAMYGAIFMALSLAIGIAATLYRRVEARARADQELQLARRIQSSFLPTRFPELRSFQLDAQNLPSKEVSGDFYDVLPAGEGGAWIAIADVAGKGVGAALLSSMLQASLRTQAPGTRSVAGILANINTLIYRHTAVEQFATFFLARLDDASGRLAFTNAGHNPPLLFRAGGGRTRLERGGPVVGILEAASYEEDEVTLAPGDRLVLYTDGITEARDGRGEQFGEERLAALVESSSADLPSQDLSRRILDAVRRHAGDRDPADDMTLLTLRMLEPARG